MSDRVHKGLLTVARSIYQLEKDAGLEINARDNIRWISPKAICAVPFIARMAVSSFYHEIPTIEWAEFVVDPDGDEVGLKVFSIQDLSLETDPFALDIFNSVVGYVGHDHQICLAALAHNLKSA